jgi:hypothetical protein
MLGGNVDQEDKRIPKGGGRERGVNRFVYFNIARRRAGNEE